MKWSYFPAGLFFLLLGILLLFVISIEKEDKILLYGGLIISVLLLSIAIHNLGITLEYIKPKGDNK